MTVEPSPDHRTDADREVEEPPNSTVDDWYGQRVDRDMKRAEEIDEVVDDPERAEELYDEGSEDARPEDLPTDERRT